MTPSDVMNDEVSESLCTAYSNVSCLDDVNIADVVGPTDAVSSGDTFKHIQYSLTRQSQVTTLKVTFKVKAVHYNTTVTAVTRQVSYEVFNTRIHVNVLAYSLFDDVCPVTIQYYVV